MFYDFELSMSDYVEQINQAGTEAENAKIQAEIEKVDGIIAQHEKKIAEYDVKLAEQEKEAQKYAAMWVMYNCVSSIQ